MLPIITAFATSPDKGRGLARDMRVRWALEEVGQPYAVRLVSFAEMKQPEHLARHPFGQIPTYEQGELVLFESAAIVLHIAETHKGLFPEDADGRARAISWMFSAQTTVEQPIVEREQAILVEAGESWFGARSGLLDERIMNRLSALSARLGTREWLEEQFTAGDLTMVLVLRRLETSDLLGHFPNLVDYVERAKARPAYRRAYDDQHAVFAALTKPG